MTALLAFFFELGGSESGATPDPESGCPPFFDFFLRGASPSDAEPEPTPTTGLYLFRRVRDGAPLAFRVS